jgi:hypothetical protein
VLIAIFCGGWATIIAAFLQNDEDVKRKALKTGIV